MSSDQVILAIIILVVLVALVLLVVGVLTPRAPAQADARLNFPDQEIIRRFAEGDSTLRSAAVDIYWKQRGAAPNDVAILFMGEILSSVPDLNLRALYRKTLLEGHPLTPMPPA